MNSLLRLFTTATSVPALLPCARPRAREVAVWHGGEKRPAWKGFAVAGGGEAAMTVLKPRTLSGNPPYAVQIKGPDIQAWGALDRFADLDEGAAQQHRDAPLPEPIRTAMKYRGNYVAVPVNVRRDNGLRIVPRVVAAAGATRPTPFEELFVVAGFIALAHGMGASGYVQGAVSDGVSHFSTIPTPGRAKTAWQLAAAI